MTSQLSEGCCIQHETRPSGPMHRCDGKIVAYDSNMPVEEAVRTVIQWDVLTAVASMVVAAVAVISLVRVAIRDFRKEVDGKFDNLTRRLGDLETSTAGFRGAMEARLNQQDFEALRAMMKNLDTGERS